MNFLEPLILGFTIYSKSGCINCNKVKALLKEKKWNFSEINFDEYVLNDKNNFLLFIKNKANTEIKTFPIVFYDNKFIGGFAEVQDFFNKILEFE